MKNNALQIGVALVLVVLLVLLLDPFMLLMPPPVAMLCIVLASALVVLFAGFVLKEQVRDEREAMHRLQSGRAGYLAGLAVLTLALIVQGFAHHVDPWIAGALAVMIVGKIVARMRAEKNS